MIYFSVITDIHLTFMSSLLIISHNIMNQLVSLTLISSRKMVFYCMKTDTSMSYNINDDNSERFEWGC